MNHYVTAYKGIVLDDPDPDPDPDVESAISLFRSVSFYVLLHEIVHATLIN